MQDLNKTTRITNTASPSAIAGSMVVTIFDGNASPKNVSLDESRHRCITFGRSETNDLVLTSRLVSREHGRFIYRNGQWFIEDKAFYSGNPSKNGLICNNTAIRFRALCEGDFIRIDDGIETIPEGVLFVFASAFLCKIWRIKHPFN